MQCIITSLISFKKKIFSYNDFMTKLMNAQATALRYNDTLPMILSD